jgi:pimeloyl-ACP methyl ester carboxylesterase
MRFLIPTLVASVLALAPGSAQATAPKKPVERHASGGKQTAEKISGPQLCGMKREYWLVKPRGFDPARFHWLVVLVHGFRSKGKEILWLRRSLADFDDCLFVAPSFPEGFQLLEERSDRQLADLFTALRRRFHLHDKMFVCGFSAGAQFGHRFTMQHPELVIGASVHSGGTWGPAINESAAHIPMSLSCGLDDEARSSIAQSLTRAQAAHRYFRELAAKQLHIKARLWPGLGHQTSASTEALIAECYQLATRGLFPGQAKKLEARMESIHAEFAAGHAATARTQIDALVPALFVDPPPKTLVRATMKAEKRRIHDVKFTAMGLGGRSCSGKSYWIDDRSENQAGWIDNEAAKKHRHRVLTRYLEQLRRRLRRTD